MFAYLKKFVIAAKAKLTVWLALLTGFWEKLPDLIHDYWDQAVHEVPRLQTFHAWVFFAGIAATIWARCRRELHPPAAAILLALLLPFLPTPALAAGHTATLTWTAPTLRVDGSAITGALTFNVYQGLGKGGESATPTLTGLTGTTFTITTGLADGTTVCWQMTAVEAGNATPESARTNEACATFPASPPTAPGAFSVTST